jgi:hypothetical protein
MRKTSSIPSANTIHSTKQQYQGVHQFLPFTSYLHPFLDVLYGERSNHDVALHEECKENVTKITLHQLLAAKRGKVMTYFNRLYSCLLITLSLCFSIFFPPLPEKWACFHLDMRPFLDILINRHKFLQFQGSAKII